MIDNKKRYVISNYGRKSTFSSFLPGISGELGIPIWCFYVNRGQAVTSFGIQDKDHSIMQFYPAHQAYQNTKRNGFRTFVKVNGSVTEAFQDEAMEHSMAIGMNELMIEETNKVGQFKLQVCYYSLSSEPLAGLIRKVTFTNLSSKTRDYEIVDGMAAILPFGVNLSTMTEMGQTAKAWMQVLNTESGVPVFKVRASMEDSAQVREVRGGNYGFAVMRGELMKPIVSPEFLFGYDTSLQRPVEFMQWDLDQLFSVEQNTQNDVPCCFFTGKLCLKPGESCTFHELFGQTEDIAYLEQLTGKAKREEFFRDKYEEAVARTLKITDKINTHTGIEVFDLYCRQTYLDNILRGGEPVILGGNKVFYLYSRKHGDIERDYNYFKLLPEYYSQGNGNFRDVNQNRRCDVRFSPYVGDMNIRLFYNAIQMDGYNPLGIEKLTYRLKKVEAAKYPELQEFLHNSFTPGQLMARLLTFGMQEYFSKIMEESEAEEKTQFYEGYWSDHWTYNLDLIEEYLTIFPDREQELLFGDRSYTFRMSKEWILPSKKRYVETNQGIRQYHFLEKNPNYDPECFVTDQNGNPVTQVLIEKLILLCLVKFAALDPYGMGIEMEGGKPGWYDALNGLPGLLGSSMAETYELGRMLEFTGEVLERYDAQIQLPVELERLLRDLSEATEGYILENGSLPRKEASFHCWKNRTKALEKYRSSIQNGILGEWTQFTSKSMKIELEPFLDTVNEGIEAAMEDEKQNGKGICPTYFYYQVNNYVKSEEGIEILDVEQKKVPYFLEGSVRYLKRRVDVTEKKRLYDAVRRSSLYDDKLHMYKVNAQLGEATYELGRARAFTPGWLENESIWLHMEYKYLLELLKSGLNEEFLQDFHQMAIPFLKEEVYGRSILENSSFLASSANPNPKIHGKGFVARLSGSTVEFLHMWQIMMFGRKPFFLKNNQLCMCLTPLIPEYLIGKDRTVEAALLGSIRVVYHLPNQNRVTGEDAEITGYQVTLADDSIVSVESAVIEGGLAETIRRGEAKEIHAYLDALRRMDDGDNL